MNSNDNSPNRLLATAGFNCLAIGSGFYLTQIISVSPIYPLLVAALVLCIFTIGLRKVAAVPETRNVVGWIVFSATTHLIGHLAWVSPFNSALGFYLNFLFLGLAWRYLPRLSPRAVDKALMRMIDFTIVLGIFEAVVRWFFPFQTYGDKFLEFVAESGSTFYMYKFNSVMYQDSNFVAMWLLVVAVVAFEHLGFVRAGKRISLLCGLVCFTICRSAIIFLTAYILAKLIRRYVPVRGLRVLLFAAGGAAGCLFLIHLVTNDDSFQSKITIYTLVTANYFSGINLQTFLLGFGMSNSALLLDGIAAHNFIAELLIDAGAIGVSYTLFSMFYLASLSGRAGYTIVWLFLLAGMSFAPITIPYLYVILSMLAFLKVSAIPATESNTRFGSQLRVPNKSHLVAVDCSMIAKPLGKD